MQNWEEIRAKEISPGDGLEDGWAVTHSQLSVPIVVDVESHTWQPDDDGETVLVVVTLMRNRKILKGAKYLRAHQVNPYAGGNYYIVPETCRTWFRANEKLRVTRSDEKDNSHVSSGNEREGEG